jgi:hypothetical protein
LCTSRSTWSGTGGSNHPPATATIPTSARRSPAPTPTTRATRTATDKVGRRRDATVAPYAGSRWANLALPCAFWPGRATERYTGPWTAHTRNPVLLLNTRYDPATPYANAVKVHRLLPNSALLTVNGVGHGGLFTSSCATALTERYLLTGATPPAGTACPQDMAPFGPVPQDAPDTRPFTAAAVSPFLPPAVPASLGSSTRRPDRRAVSALSTVSVSTAASAPPENPELG